MGDGTDIRRGTLVVVKATGEHGFVQRGFKTPDQMQGRKPGQYLINTSQSTFVFNREAGKWYDISELEILREAK